MYFASYDFGDFEITQYAVKLTPATTESNDESLSLLVNWIESNLSQLPNSGASLSFHSNNGKLNRYLRLYSSATIETIKSHAEKIKLQPIVVEMVTEREQFDELFTKESAHLAMIPNSTYQASGVDMVTDYLFTDSFEEVACNLAMSKINFNYQLNFSLLSAAQDSIRFVKKSVVRLEEKPGVPQSLIKQQRWFAIRAQKCQWIAEEYLATNNAADFDIISDMLSQCFAVENEKYGFPTLTLLTDEAVEDQYYSGLHSRVFEPITAIDEASQLMSDINITNLLKSNLPELQYIDDTNSTTNVLPAAISDSGLWDVFLSHSSKDHLITKATCHYLEAQGIRCWMAPRDITAGELWSQEIMNGIKHSKVCVLILSGAANESRYVLREIEQSVNLAHPILPLRIEDIYPSDSLNFFVSSHHWYDAVNGSLEEHLPALTKTILPHL